MAPTAPAHANALELVLAHGRIVRVAPRFDAVTLRQLVTALELLASLHECQRDNEALRHRLDLLLRRLFGPRGERFDPSQALLFPELAAGQDTAAGPAEASSAKPQLRCRAHGHRRLPAHLPQESRHHERVEHFVHKYACLCCSRALHAQEEQRQSTAEPEPMPLSAPDPPPAATASAAAPHSLYTQPQTPAQQRAGLTYRQRRQACNHPT